MAPVAAPRKRHQDHESRTEPLSGICPQISGEGNAAWNIGLA